MVKSCTIFYSFNRTITSGSDITPPQKFYGTKPFVNKIRLFGSLTYVYTYKKFRNKLYPKSNVIYF